MSKFENPIQFDVKIETDLFVITYSNLMEICQGGPVVGMIYINGNPIKSYFFGGPCISHREYVYATVYVKKFFRSGFKIAKINCKTLDVEFFGEIKDIIFLDRIDNNKLLYYEDMEKNIQSIMVF